MVKAVNRGIPFVLYQRNHPLTKQFAGLAKQLALAATEGSALLLRVVLVALRKKENEAYSRENSDDA